MHNGYLSCWRKRWMYLLRPWVNESSVCVRMRESRTETESEEREHELGERTARDIVEKVSERSTEVWQ
jgi:hypothetical protein